MANKKNIVIKVKYPTSRYGEAENKKPAGIKTEWDFLKIAIALGIIALIVSISMYFSFPESKSPISSPSLAENTESPQANQTPLVKSEISSEINNKEPLPGAHKVNAEQPAQYKLSEVNKVVPSEVMNQLKDDIGGEQADNNDQAMAKEQAATLKKEKPTRIRNKIIRSMLASKIVNKEPVHILKSPVSVSKSKLVWINYFTELKGMNKKTIYHEWIYQGRIVFRQRINIAADRWRAATRKSFNHTSKGLWQVRAVDEKGNLLDQLEFKVILTR